MESLDSFFQNRAQSTNVSRYGTVTNNNRQYRAKHTVTIPRPRSLNSNSHCGSSVADTADTHSNGDEFYQYTSNGTPYYNLVPHGRESISPTPNDEAISYNNHDHLAISTLAPPDGPIPTLSVMDASSNRSLPSTNGSLFHHSTASKSKDGMGSSSIDEQIIRENREDSHHPLLGMILVTLSALLYAALNLSVKALMYETPWQELMFIRMSITWSATMVWILAQYRGKLKFCGPSHQRIWLLVRGAFLWGAMFTCWWSFEFLPVGMYCGHSVIIY